MRMIDLALKDLLQIFRDWKAALFLLVMPIAFTLLFGVIFGNSGGEGGDPRIPIGFVDQDEGMLSPYLLEMLENSEVIRPEILSNEEDIASFEKMVEDEQYVGVVIVPVGYSNSLIDGTSQKLRVILNPDSNAGATVQSDILSLVNRLVKLADAARFSTTARESNQPFADDSERKMYTEQALELAAASWESPPFRLVIAKTSQEMVGEEDDPYGENPFAHSSVGMMLQFAVAGLIGAAEVLVIERKSHSLQRLLTTPIKRWEVLLGHFLAMFAMVFIQIAILITFGQLFLDVPYFNSPLGTLLVGIGTTLFVASLGLLIGTAAKTPDQVVLFALLPMFVLSGLGGAWVPLEFTSRSFQTIGHFTPLAWAMDGFKNIIVRGQGVTSTLLPTGVLLLFAAVLFGLSVWQFNHSEEG
jgi:ABC-2 type transport system permease protein